jgi:hypothetical protein
VSRSCSSSSGEFAAPKDNQVVQFFFARQNMLNASNRFFFSTKNPAKKTTCYFSVYNGNSFRMTAFFCQNNGKYFDEILEKNAIKLHFVISEVAAIIVNNVGFGIGFWSWQKNMRCSRV